jgi:chromosome segregation ATPase
MNELEKIVQKIEEKLAILERSRETLNQELEYERAQLQGIEQTLTTLRTMEAQMSPSKTVKRKK